MPQCPAEALHPSTHSAATRDHSWHALHSALLMLLLFLHLMGILAAYLLLEISAHPWQLGTHGSPRATVNEVLFSPHNYHHPKCSDTSLSFLPSVPPFSALLISLLPHCTPHLPVPHPALRWPVVQPGPTQPDGRAPSHSAKTARNTICRGFFQETALHSKSQKQVIH